MRAVIVDLGGTLWYWGLCQDHLREALPERTGPLLAGREAFAGAMVTSEDEYGRRAREEEYGTVPTTIAMAGFGEPEVLAGRLLILLEGAWATAVVRRDAGPLDSAREVARLLMRA